MALKLKNVKGQLGSTATLLTVPANQTFIIQNITVHNGSGSDVSNIQFYIVPSGGSSSASTIFIDIGSLLAGETRQINLKHNLISADFIRGSAATSNSVNYIISYAQKAD